MVCYGNTPLLPLTLLDLQVEINSSAIGLSSGLTWKNKPMADDSKCFNGGDFWWIIYPPGENHLQDSKVPFRVDMLDMLVPRKADL